MKFTSLIATTISLAASHATVTDAAFALVGVGKGSRSQVNPLQSFFADFFSPQTRSKLNDDKAEDENKVALLELLEKVPPNESTPKELTSRILEAVSVLESECKTSDDDVLSSLVGNWELIWTAQDSKNLPANQRNPFRNWINPLENQSYSNNPNSGGRSNPILPQNMQNTLEDIGVLSDRKAENTIKSTQAIDLKRKRVRNVVAFEANNPTPIFSKNGKTKGFITVDVNWDPNPTDARKIDVKFDRFSVTILESPINVSLPLGIIGPSGWLRTGYIDNDIRITRGHKGSVFILSRTARK